MQTKSQPLNARAHRGQLGRGRGAKEDGLGEEGLSQGKHWPSGQSCRGRHRKERAPRPEAISLNRGLLKRHPVLKMGKKCLYLTGTRKISAPSSFTETRPILPSSLRRYPTHPVADAGNSPGGRLLVHSCSTYELLRSVPAYSLLPYSSSPYRLKRKVEISQMPPCAWNGFSAPSEQGQVNGTNGGSERWGEEGRERVATWQDTKPGNNPVFASLTKENEGPEPGWLELTVEKPLL